MQQSRPKLWDAWWTINFPIYMWHNILHLASIWGRVANPIQTLGASKLVTDAAQDQTPRRNTTMAVASFLLQFDTGSQIFVLATIVCTCLSAACWSRYIDKLSFTVFSCFHVHHHIWVLPTSTRSRSGPILGQILSSTFWISILRLLMLTMKDMGYESPLPPEIQLGTPSSSPKIWQEGPGPTLSSSPTNSLQDPLYVLHQTKCLSRHLRQKQRYMRSKRMVVSLKQERSWLFSRISFWMPLLS